ncbi:sugar ABC transporter permease [Piscinibacter gummiphilus]|uniref:Sugar ABC transporter permease n=1 Tax=Piscinibacter gummiphilus TaxID=946333 RepID=A0ABZ0CU00_9BURK|nr:sugar ABC transporter permease [Piscinibacter gummiphilus]WOB08446.1 sugar ABC transporter permease [Piscinibacter gummiphilus]
MSEPLTPEARTAAPTEPRHKRTNLRTRLRGWVPYLFISPFFVIFLVFGLFPLLFSVYLSFHRWEPAAGLAAMNWVGFENYVYIVLNDDWFHKSLYNTGWMAIVSGVPQHLVALPLAFFLHMAFKRWRNAVVGAYFLPFITSSVAISLVFSTLFSRDYGVINASIAALHELPVFSWFLPAQNIDWGQPQYTKWMISFVVFWRYVGWNTVLYLSAMQTIPKDLFEAATMDGATRWQQFRHVVLPLLRPMIFFAVTLTIIGNLQLFEEPFILTGGTGGIDQAGKTAAMHMYATAFVDGDFGTASAVAWLLFMLIAAVTWLNNKLLGQKEDKA